MSFNFLESFLTSTILDWFLWRYSESEMSIESSSGNALGTTTEEGMVAGLDRRKSWPIVLVETSTLNLTCPFKFEASGLNLYIPVTVIKM